jgi:hypothetical protein
MMRQLFHLGLILAAIASPVFSQQPATRVNEDNLYHKALYASLDKMNVSWGAIKYANGEPGPIDYHNMVVQENRDITNGLPSQFGAYHVEYLDSQGLIDRYKKLRKDFAILVVYPMDNSDGTRLRIAFNVYWISYKKNRLNFALSDWSHVYFRYDCEKREYVIDEVKLGGI